MLRVEKHFRVVEVGFGPASTACRILRMCDNELHYEGFDISESMHVEAKKKPEIQRGVENGNVRLHLSNVEETGLPFTDESVDIVYHANLLYFVNDPLALTKQFYRVLKKHGRLGMVLASETIIEKFKQDKIDSPFRHSFTKEQAIELCKNAGFSDVAYEIVEDTAKRQIIVATKS